MMGKVMQLEHALGLFVIITCCNLGGPKRFAKASALV
jgi:hypothetical protein